MKLPRDVSGQQLQRALRRLGYEAVRQRGSHVRLTTQVNGEHAHRTRQGSSARKDFNDEGDNQLFKQFMDNDGFKRWMADTVFDLTSKHFDAPPP